MEDYEKWDKFANTANEIYEWYKKTHPIQALILPDTRFKLAYHDYLEFYIDGHKYKRYDWGG